MTNEPVERNLLNPFMLWTDWGMRAAEAAMASTQNMAEGADRLTRAAASAEVEDAPSSNRAPSDTWATAGLGGMVDMQRVMWELTTRSWTEWMTMTGNLMSAGTGVGLARGIATQQPNPLRLVHDSVEHALASPESRPRARKQPARRRSSHKR